MLHQTKTQGFIPKGIQSSKSPYKILSISKKYMSNHLLRKDTRSKK